MNDKDMKDAVSRATKRVVILQEWQVHRDSYVTTGDHAEFRHMLQSVSSETIRKED